MVDLSISTPAHFHGAMKSLGFFDKVIGCYNNPDLNPISLLSVQPINPDMRTPCGNRNALFTMWESSKLDDRIARKMAAYDLILTPNSFNACTFSEQTGKPCKVVNLGCDHSLYYPDLKNYKTRMSSDSVFKFGAAAHIGHGRTRKGFDRILEWFTEAFPGNNKVCLSFKANKWTGNKFKCSDPRIEIIEEDMPDEQCAKWLRSLDCYIDAATFEGWGMWTHAAMATGRTVIACNYSARSEYFEFGNHIPIGYSVVKSIDRYDGVGPLLGHWAMPKKSDGIAAMKWAFKNREACFKIGEKAHESTKHLTWDLSAKTIISHLKDHKIVGNRVLL